MEDNCQHRAFLSTCVLTIGEKRHISHVERLDYGSKGNMGKLKRPAGKRPAKRPAGKRPVKKCVLKRPSQNPGGDDRIELCREKIGKVDRVAFVNRLAAWAKNSVPQREIDCILWRNDWKSAAKSFYYRIGCRSCTKCGNGQGWKAAGRYIPETEEMVVTGLPVTAHGDFTHQYGGREASLTSEAKAWGV